MLISKFNITNVDKSMNKFEQKYNFMFPVLYKEFLLKYNGGKTPNTSFRIKKISSDLSGFFGFDNAEDYFNYEYVEAIFGFNGWIEDGMLPIGKNVFGDYIMIGLREENEGKIFFVYHDRENKYIELCGDFIEFINKCKSKRIGHIRTIEERKQDMIKNGLEDKITLESLKGWQAEIDRYANICQEELILPNK